MKSFRPTSSRGALESPEDHAFGLRQRALNDEADQSEKSDEQDGAQILDEARNLKSDGFRTRVQQHDDEDKQHHDRAARRQSPAPRR